MKGNKGRNPNPIIGFGIFVSFLKMAYGGIFRNAGPSRKGDTERFHHFILVNGQKVK